MKDPSEAADEGTSPETLRKQYKELWQLRATFEAEEKEMTADSNKSGHQTRQQPRNSDQKLVKNDSGLKMFPKISCILFKLLSIYSKLCYNLLFHLFQL